MTDYLMYEIIGLGVFVVFILVVVVREEPLD